MHAHPDWSGSGATSAGHATHSLLPGALTEELGQVIHELRSQMWPAGQLQEVEPGSEVAPAGQVEQSSWYVSGRYVFAGQALHTPVSSSKY